MMRIVGSAALLLWLTSCTPADVDYCRGFGVEGTAEYSKCIGYYHQQQQAFTADREMCDAQADLTYPPSLMDRGGYARTSIGTGWGMHGYGGQTIRIEPDHRRNAEIQRLRMRIITPCMRTQGWNSGSNWQAGRSEVRPSPAAKPPKNTLPWLTR
jgi:hypothetical protein